ncbi:MAG: metallophosphoesterase [Bacteroidales bacterium]|jgi:calcineurin-like phosphoesterase family protein|nr:metallophosphoesterase [Bacteroidales bacterium]
MIFYTADLHFGHKNILEYCDRPFQNVNEMNETLIQNWNNVVTKNDAVYVLGDMFFYELPAQKQIMKKLNGKKILIRGNHDEVKGSRKDKMKLSDYLEVGWSEVVLDMLIIKNFGLTHDPALCNIDLSMKWLCGHVHRLFVKQGNVLNVGVDVHNFTPLNEEQVLKYFY